MQSFPLPKSRVKDVMVSNLQASVRKRLFGAQTFHWKTKHPFKISAMQEALLELMDFDGMYMSESQIPPSHQATKRQHGKGAVRQEYQLFGIWHGWQLCLEDIWLKMGEFPNETCFNMFLANMLLAISCS